MKPLRHLLVCLVVPTCIPLCAWAQVQRCTDASGHVTYTNSPCPSGQRSHEVVPALSEAERQQQTAQYQQALERRRAAQALELQREALRPTPPPAPHHPTPVVVEVAAPAPSVVYSPLYPPPRPPHAHPPQLPPPPSTVGQQCNVFRCYDGKGNTWSRP